jgi:hypothetical protein
MTDVLWDVTPCAMIQVHVQTFQIRQHLPQNIFWTTLRTAPPERPNLVVPQLTLSIWSLSHLVEFV